MKSDFCRIRRAHVVWVSMLISSLVQSAVAADASQPMEMTMGNSGQVTSANPSIYRILPRPLPEHVGKHLPYSTTNQAAPNPSFESKPTGPYAYGWFGPKSTPEWSRHFGYGRRYTQWTLK